MDSPSADTETAPRTRRPKSELDRELKLLRQIESRWRQLSFHSKLLVLESLAADLDNVKETPDGR
jgi:hypothetical protein